MNDREISRQDPSAPAVRPRARGSLIVLFVGVLVISLGSRSEGQTFGRWWWDGELSLRQRAIENLRSGREVSRFDEQELRLGFGLNGYLGHPAIGNFRLGLDLSFAEVEGGRPIDTDRTGFSLDLGLLPQGKYPARLFALRQSYDYSSSTTDDPFLFLRTPDTTTSWGGSLRARRGSLRGLVLGLRHTTFDYLDPGERRQLDQRQSLDWTRAGKRAQHHARLEHRLRDYGSSDFELEDITANLDQRGDLGSWRWQFSGNAIHRTSRRGTRPEASTDDLRLRPRFYREIRERDQIDLSANINILEPEGLPSRRGYGLSAFYRWRPRPGIELAPFAQYGSESAGEASLQAPQLGVSLSWFANEKKIDRMLTATAGFGELKTEDSRGSATESLVSYGLSGSIGHGRMKGLRKELEAQLTHNELSLGRDRILDLPGLGLSRGRPGVDDSARVRATLSHAWDSKAATLWGEWLHRESSADNRIEDFSSETVSGNLQFSAARFNVTASLGDTRVDLGTGEEQSIQFAGAAAAWKPTRGLSFHASYRADARDILLAPDIDGDRLEAGVEFRAGLLSLRADLFETNEDVVGGSDRENRGFRWSLSRRFAYWLPITTGTKRRGVIR